MHNPNTTIHLDNAQGFDKVYNSSGMIDDWSGNVLMIGSEAIEILPLNSPDGVLFTITDGEKAVWIRLKRPVAP